MNKSRFLVIAAFAALVLLIGVWPLEGAGQDRPPNQHVTFTYSWQRTLEPGKYWIDEQGVHIRNRVDEGTIGGDLTGTATVVYNADLTSSSAAFLAAPGQPFLPGSGESYGTMAIYGFAHDQRLPDWSGEWTYKLENGQVVGGSLFAHSGNGRWVMDIDTVFQSERGAVTHSGFIVNTCLELPCDGSDGS